MGSGTLFFILFKLRDFGIVEAQNRTFGHHASDRQFRICTAVCCHVRGSVQGSKHLFKVQTRVLQDLTTNQG